MTKGHMTQATYPPSSQAATIVSNGSRSKFPKFLYVADHTTEANANRALQCVCVCVQRTTEGRARSFSVSTFRPTT